MRLARLSIPLFLLAACAGHTVAAPTISDAAGSIREGLDAGDLRCTLIDLRGDPDELALVARAVREATPRVHRWGTFHLPITVRILADHAALESAAKSAGARWLRAWSFDDELLLQSPRTWDEIGALRAAGPDALEQELTDVLAHELTHSLMYQLLARPGDGVLSGEPPLWFREGMASLTAGQGSKRLTSEELARWLAANPGAEPLDPSPELLRDKQTVVYSAAHRAFALLVAACGDATPLGTLAAMREGATFADAFEKQTGLSPDAFSRRARLDGFDLASAPLLCRARR